MRRLRIVSLSFFLSFPNYGWTDTGAQPNATLAPAPALPSQTSFGSGFSFSGYIEPSYNYLVRSNHFTSGIHDRLFDLEPKGFTLQQAAITLSNRPLTGFGALLNLILGRDANTLAPAGVNPNYFGIQNLGLTATQVYLQYAYGRFTVLAGRYNCVIGKENYNPTLDTNFSRSILDGYAQPGTFIGILGRYAFSDHLTFTADLSNGWGTIKYTGRQKTLEVGAVYTPNENSSWSIAGVTGEQPITDGASSGPTGRRSALDLIGNLRITPKLSLAANYDYGLQTRASLPQGKIGRAIWQGLTGYVNYQFTDKWQSSLRGEVFSDQRGYRTGVRQTWKEVTATLAYALRKNIQIRAETRHDFSNVKSFVNLNGVGANTQQQSFALEGLYQF